VENLKEELASLTREARHSFAEAEKLVTRDLLEEWGLRDNDEGGLARVAEEIRYRRTVQQLPCRARHEAIAGKQFAIVYSFGCEETRPVSLLPPVGEDAPHFCTSEMLIGVAQRVYNHCVAERLFPTIERWENRLNRGGGWNLVIHW
jgi:hypothetical protein